MAPPGPGASPQWSPATAPPNYNQPGQSPVAPPPPSSGGGRGRTILLAVGAVLLLGIIGTVAALTLGGDDDVETATEATDDESSDAEATDSTGSDTDTDSTGDDPAVDAGEIPGAEQLARSVVQIQLLLDGQPVCTGSGTVVDTTGTIVTNFHVVEQSPICPHDEIGVAVADSSGAVPDLAYVADLLVFDSALDLAVVRISATIDGGAVSESFEPIELGDSDQVELGDQIQVIGFPGIGGETVTFTTGSVSGFAETPEGGDRSWLKTDATIAGGNSGGLAADADGRFVGIPTRAGSGDGEIVDCRIITDSNGDGELSQDDSCVPIGGFINGIRPLSLALPLIDAAETATAIDQGPPPRDEPMSTVLPFAFAPTWASAVDADGVAVDDLVVALTGAPELCLTWSYEDVPEGALIEGAWFIDGEIVPEASIEPENNQGPTSGEAWACITATDGLPAGVYEFVWFIDEELVFAEGIVVGDGSTAVVEVVNVSGMPLCVVQFNPSGTATWGLNELTEPVEPGETFLLMVGVGPTDARIIDCNGDIRIEDASGFVIDEDIEVTVE